MTKYIRKFSPGSTYFFTVCLADKQSNLLVEEVDLLRDVTRLCQKQRPFVINAAVILPSELHMIWRLPPGDADYSARWRQIKSTFSRHIPTPCGPLTPSMANRGEKGIWQRRFWEHRIRDQDDYDRHDHLIATAPLRAGLLRDQSEWPLCSAYQRRMRFNASNPAARTTALAP